MTVRVHRHDRHPARLRDPRAHRPRSSTHDLHPPLRPRPPRTARLRPGTYRLRLRLARGRPGRRPRGRPHRTGSACSSRTAPGSSPRRWPPGVRHPGPGSAAGAWPCTPSPAATTTSKRRDGDHTWPRTDRTRAPTSTADPAPCLVLAGAVRTSTAGTTGSPTLGARPARAPDHAVTSAAPPRRRTGSAASMPTPRPVGRAPRRRPPSRSPPFRAAAEAAGPRRAARHQRLVPPESSARPRSSPGNAPTRSWTPSPRAAPTGPPAPGAPRARRQNVGSQRLLARGGPGRPARPRPVDGHREGVGRRRQLHRAGRHPDTVARACLDYVDIGATTLLIRGYDPLDGRHRLRPAPPAAGPPGARPPRRHPARARPGRRPMSAAMYTAWT